MFEELWNYGFPQEMRHFARCVRGEETPIATARDGRFAQLAMFAAHAVGPGPAGAWTWGTGSIRAGTAKPIDLWFEPLAL